MFYRSRPTKYKSLLLIILLTALFGVVTGCGGKEQTPDSAQGEYFKAEFHPAVTPVPTGQEILYTLSLTHDNQSVSGAKVEVALEMKEMDHGENRFALKETKPGVYEGKAILPMSGTWQAYIRVEKDGKSETLLSTFEAAGEMVEHK